jgi:hypothetical protein
MMALRSRCFLFEVVSGDFNFTPEKLVAEATKITQRQVKNLAVRAGIWYQNQLATNTDAYRTGKAVVMILLRSEDRGNAIAMTVILPAGRFTNWKPQQGNEPLPQNG